MNANEALSLPNVEYALWRIEEGEDDNPEYIRGVAKQAREVMQEQRQYCRVLEGVYQKLSDVTDKMLDAKLAHIETLTKYSKLLDDYTAFCRTISHGVAKVEAAIAPSTVKTGEPQMSDTTPQVETQPEPQPVAPPPVEELDEFEKAAIEAEFEDEPVEEDEPEDEEEYKFGEDA